MRISYPWFHRREQWDLNCWPLLCVHWKSPRVSSRIFCLWTGGIQVGKWRWIWRAAAPEGARPSGEASRDA